MDKFPFLNTAAMKVIPGFQTLANVLCEGYIIILINNNFYKPLYILNNKI